MWSSSSARHHQINYGIPSEMGMLGLRDLFVVAPASSFQHHQGEQIVSDPHSINASNAATALGVGVIPLLTATPCYANQTNLVEEDMMNSSNSRNRNDHRTGGIQFWQQTQQTQQQNSNYFKKPGTNIIDHHHTAAANLLQSSGGIGGGGGIGGSGSSGVTTCQDCGNQAKKDCTHRRCRTCCKSRGFDCATHVKSTWVPAARRRERQLIGAAGATAGSSASTSGAKKARLTSQTTTTSHTSTSNTTPPRSYETSSSHQDAGFKESLPGQVRAPAVFKCVRVTSVEDGDDEYAYQAVVKIGGRVFKGFLYDQGVEPNIPNLSELHLGGAASGSGGGGRNVASSSSPILDPSDVYASGGGGGLLGNSTYGNTIN